MKKARLDAADVTADRTAAVTVEESTEHGKRTSASASHRPREPEQREEDAAAGAPWRSNAAASSSWTPQEWTGGWWQGRKWSGSWGGSHWGSWSSWSNWAGGAWATGAWTRGADGSPVREAAEESYGTELLLAAVFFLAVAYMLNRVRQERGAASRSGRPLPEDPSGSSEPLGGDNPISGPGEETEGEARPLSASSPDESWELLTEPVTERDRGRNDEGRYSQTGAGQTAARVLAALSPVARARAERLQELPAKHIVEVCRRRGLEVTGTKLMNSIMLVACDNRRTEWADVLVDRSI